MTDALIDLDPAPRPTARMLRVVERRQPDARDTAPHDHAQGQLLGSLAGVLSVRAATGRWIVPASHAVWVPPNVPHALRSHGAFAGWSVYVDAVACGRLPGEARTVRVDPLLRELVHRMAGWGDDALDEAGQRLAAVALDEIATLPAEPLGLAEPRDPRAAGVAHGILADLADDRSVAEWSAIAGLTPRTLARRFRAETGLGLGAWRQRARVLAATEMLADGVPVTTVALDLGYAGAGAFIDMFRRATGTTPGRYGRDTNPGRRTDP